LRSVALALTAIAAIQAAPAATTVDDGRNLFDWSALAPVVVAGTCLGEDGRYFEFRIAQCLRGDAQPADVLNIDVREANRTRDRMLHPKPLRLDAGIDYVLLLERTGAAGRDRYRLVRGVTGARELPLEGREAYLEALREFIVIQDSGSEELKWQRLGGLLGGSNPILIQTSLEQFLKFRRGDAELLLTLLPLLDHPQPPLRAESAQLIGQIVERQRERGTLEDDEAVRAELIARATRDASVPVRVAATEALAAFPLELVDQVLVEIAETDPEQQVRYTAQLVRLARRRETGGKGQPATVPPPPVD